MRNGNDLKKSEIISQIIMASVPDVGGRMTKLPSFQFYPGDWLKDPGLSSVSKSAKGLWVDMLCLMFESEKRGFLQINDKAPSEEQLARMANCSTENLSQWLSELKEAGVFSQTRNGIIYSRRMVKDDEIRNKRKEAGKMGGNPHFETGKSNPYYRREDKQKDNQGDKQRDKQKITPSSSSSSSSSSSRLKDKDLPPIGGLPSQTGPPKNSPKVETSVQKAVLAFKIASGYEKEDKAWDKLNFSRCSKPAKQLVDFLGSWEDAADCIQDIYEGLTAKGLTVTLETVVKHAATWKLNKREREAKNGVLPVPGHGNFQAN